MTLTAKQRQSVVQSVNTANIDVYTRPSPSSQAISLWWFALLIPVLFFYSIQLHATELPDFKSLVENNGGAVVKVSVTTKASKNTTSQRGIPGVDPDQLPDFLKKYLDQMPNLPRREQKPGHGFGSGFIVSEDGYIITNAHVVENASDIRVSLQDRHNYPATLIGADERTDVALIKIDETGLPVVKLGDSDEVKVGQWVLAIGSPFGFEYTATQGIVSAVARSLPDDTYVPFIQTDAAVNPGNSGGPLFNTDGEVIGVNSQIYSRSGGYMGLSFAIPINVVKNIYTQLKDKGYASRGWLGVVIQNVDQALAESFGLEKPEGALIAQVTEDSPAEKSGLQTGDIILSFNGSAVSRSSDLPPIVGRTPAGSSAPVIVMRGGEKITIDVTVGELDEGHGKQQKTIITSADETVLGATVSDLTDEQKKQLNTGEGAFVSEVEPGGAASEAGIMQGDVIVSFNKVKVESVKQLRKMIKDAPRKQAFPVLIQRQGNPTFLALTLKD